MTNAKRNVATEVDERRVHLALTGTRLLNRDDYIAAAAYAAKWPADPFAYARALSRLRYCLLLEE